MRFDESDAARLEKLSARNRASKSAHKALTSENDHIADAGKKVNPLLPRPGKSANRSKLEEEFAAQLLIAGMPKATREHRFHPKRKWQFDFAWPAFRLAVEIEGGLYGTSRHTTVRGFNNDCEKYNAALCMGWRVLRVTDRHVKSGKALEWAREGLVK